MLAQFEIVAVRPIDCHSGRKAALDGREVSVLFGLDALAERELSRRAPNKRVGRSLVEDEARADDAVNPGRERIVSAACQRRKPRFFTKNAAMASRGC